MYDFLDCNIVLKVFSHQLTEDFVIKDPGKSPQPNLCVVSANQFADNAATQAKQVIQIEDTNYEQIFFPAFSFRWCFSYEGCLTNKGATKVLYDKMDQELFSRMQHRKKQGLFHRLFSFNALQPDQIGKESLLRSIVKQTATCWTRAIYRFPPLAKQIWKIWRSYQSEEDQNDFPVTLPKDWQKKANPRRENH